MSFYCGTMTLLSSHAVSSAGRRHYVAFFSREMGVESVLMSKMSSYKYRH